MGVVTPFPERKPVQVAFERVELMKILDLYAIALETEVAAFSAFRRATERPEFRIEKRPALRNRQGMWALIGESGTVLKRGQELVPILAPVERRLLRLVGE
jgi:hypothetical protein